MNFQVTDTPINIRKRGKWSKVREAVRNLPEGKSVRLAVPAGIDPYKFSVNVRNNFVAKRDGFRSVVNLRHEDNAVYITRAAEN